MSQAAAVQYTLGIIEVEPRTSHLAPRTNRTGVFMGRSPSK